MSFRIYVSGSNGFRYERNNCADDDVFEAAAVISALNASGPSVGGVVEGVADYALPSVGVLDGVNAVARMEMMHLLRTSVSLLAMSRNTSRGWLAVSASESRMLLPARTGFARYDFIAGEDAASEFIRTILPALTASGFNNYGVFRALSGAITAYNDHRPSSGPPMLLMQLSK